jgi:hypothetical protein
MHREKRLSLEQAKKARFSRSGTASNDDQLGHKKVFSLKLIEQKWAVEL